MCDDRMLRALEARHFNPILLPRTGFEPLGVLGAAAGGARDLQYLGGLDELVDPPPGPWPTVRRDDGAPAFSEQRTSRLDAGAGLALVARLAKAFGATVGLAAQAQQAGGWEVVLQDVRQDWVSTLALGGFMAAGPRLRPGMAALLARYDAVYLVTDILKSPSFGVVAYQGSGAGVALKADALQELLHVSAGLQAGRAGGDVLCYQGDRPLAFAFRAVPLWVSLDGAGVTVGTAQEDGLASRAFAGDDDELPLEAYPLLAPGGLVDVRPPAPR